MTTGRCEFKTAIGRKWNMRYRYAADILAPCENNFISTVTIKRNARGRDVVETMKVCGVHRNVIIRRANKFGWEISIAEIN